MLERILVPLDGSTSAEAILSQLRRILPRHESQLTLFHALPLYPVTDHTDPEKYLRRLAFQLTTEGYPSQYLLRPGLAADAILDAAKAEGATLIALSTHGRTGVARWVLGSVAEKVLQASPLPVLVARSFPSSTFRGKLESQQVRNFLVPLDGSRLSLEALQPLRALARPVDAHVTLLHVSEPTPYEGRWESPDETLQEAERVLREACIPATVELRKGDSGDEILKCVDEKGIDLIVMTTHGRTGPSRWVFGSVTAKVLRAANVPLLVVRMSAPKAPEEKKTKGVDVI
jgi:nucleotide-binding universal stress UspA family protein